MRIIENSYKLGEKVGVTNGDNPQRIDPGWVVGIDLSDGLQTITYRIADSYDESRRKFSWVYDGVKGSDIWPAGFINSE